MKRALILGTCLVLILLAGALPVGQAFAQAVQPASGIPAGTLIVSGSTWNFDGDVTAGAGPWTQVTVTNTNCETPYRPGTAQAGAIILTAQLAPTPTPSGFTAYQGNLLPFTGTTASGHVRVTVPAGADPPTHIDATIYGLEQFALDNTFNVCLTGSGAAATLTQQILAGLQQVQAMSYDVTGIVSTIAQDGSTLIAISGMQVPAADGYTQWVFFFRGTMYLGTDTAVPSPQLQLTGSPGPGQVNVQYTAYAPNDPLCCPSLPPVTITYTWNGSALVPNGTPPGH